MKAISSDFDVKYLKGIQWLATLGIFVSSFALAASLIASEGDGTSILPGSDPSSRSAAPSPTDLGGGCSSHPAPSSLDWPTSGVWKGEQIVFADVLARNLVSIKPGQQRVIQVQKTLGGGPSEALSEIRAIPDGSGDFLVEDEAGRDGDRLVRIDSQMNPLSTIAIQGRSLGRDAVLDVVYDWQPAIVGDNRLGVLAFADFLRAGKWKSGLVFFGDEVSPQVFQEWPIGLDFVFQHTQETGYLGVLGSRGVMLVWDTVPYLLRVDLSANGLKSEPQRLTVPGDLGSRPAVKSHDDWKFTVRPAEQMMLHYKLSESSSGASSIFTVDSRLYLVSRKVGDDGVAWYLSDLDVSEGVELSRSRIPVSKQTRHLTVAASENFVGILEKGAVENISGEGWTAPFLPTRNVVIIPTSKITSQHRPGEGVCS